MSRSARTSARPDGSRSAGTSPSPSPRRWRRDRVAPTDAIRQRRRRLECLVQRATTVLSRESEISSAARIGVGADAHSTSTVSNCGECPSVASHLTDCGVNRGTAAPETVAPITGEMSRDTTFSWNDDAASRRECGSRRMPSTPRCGSGAIDERGQRRGVHQGGRGERPRLHPARRWRSSHRASRWPTAERFRRTKLKCRSWCPHGSGVGRRGLGSTNPSRYPTVGPGGLRILASPGRTPGLTTATLMQRDVSHNGRTGPTRSRMWTLGGCKPPLTS